MTSEQWRSVARIVHSASEVPEAERQVFIESQTTDPEVARRVIELLEAQLEDERFAAAPVDRTGSQVGRYQVGALLGRGGMGEVYAARDNDLGRPVALKFLSAGTTGPAAVKRFVREAKAASALNHPNILTVHEVIQSPSGLAIAMELVEGRVVSEFRGTALPIPQVAALGRQVASALAAAHEQGIVHRDIKPENMMVRPDGLVKVLDFGLAHDFAGQLTATLQPSAGALPAGTLRYMSPEQLREEPLTGASDVFSLGIVLYELAAGRHPFESEYAWATAHAIHTREAAPPSSVNREVPAWLDDLILSMLQRHAATRPTARCVETALATSSAAMLPPRRQMGALRGLRFPRRAQWAALAIAVIGLVSYDQLSRRNGSSEALLKLTPLTSFGGHKDFPAFSPDGSWIAFAWDGDSENLGEKSEVHIYVKPVGKGEPKQLSFSPNRDVAPSWSPDGRSIAYCHETPDLPGFQINVVSVDGGPPHKVAEGTELGVSWSPDGKTLALAHRANGVPSAGQQSGGIYLLSLKTGASRELTTGHFDYLPQFSPDGKWIGFTRVVSGTVHEMFVISSDGGAPRQLTFDREPAAGVTWTADSREIVFSSTREGAGPGLWRVPIRGGAPVSVLANLRSVPYATISRQGGRLAFADILLDTNIYLRTGSGFQNAPVPGAFGEPAGVVISSRADHSPAISPDGEQIAFVSGRSGYDEVWTSRRDGAKPVQLTSLRSANLGTPRWSPDGRWIAFDSSASGEPEIFVVDSRGGVPRQVSSDTHGNYMPSWSADGKWIYHTSPRSGRKEIWRTNASGGVAEQVTHGGAYEAMPSPDGRLVYFTKPQAKGTIWSVPVAGGPESPVAELQSFERIMRSWGVLKEGIYFLPKDELSRAEVRFFSFRTHRVTPLFPLLKQTEWDWPGVSLSQDGRYALITQVDNMINDLMMIENFR